MKKQNGPFNNKFIYFYEKKKSRIRNTSPKHRGYHTLIHYGDKKLALKTPIYKEVSQLDPWQWKVLMNILSMLPSLYESQFLMSQFCFCSDKVCYGDTYFNKKLYTCYVSLIICLKLLFKLQIHWLHQSNTKTFKISSDVKTWALIIWAFHAISQMNLPREENNPVFIPGANVWWWGWG